MGFVVPPIPRFINREGGKGGHVISPIGSEAWVLPWGICDAAVSEYDFSIPPIQGS